MKEILLLASRAKSVSSNAWPGHAECKGDKGKKVVKRCPKCDFDNAPDSKFCKECGTRLGGDEPNSPEFGIVSPGSKTETLQTPVNELTPASTFAGRCHLTE